jgi:hypothetical protein
MTNSKVQRLSKASVPATAAPPVASIEGSPNAAAGARAAGPPTTVVTLPSSRRWRNITTMPVQRSPRRRACSIALLFLHRDCRLASSFYERHVSNPAAHTDWAFVFCSRGKCLSYGLRKRTTNEFSTLVMLRSSNCRGCCDLGTRLPSDGFIQSQRRCGKADHDVLECATRISMRSTSDQ